MTDRELVDLLAKMRSVLSGKGVDFCLEADAFSRPRIWVHVWDSGVYGYVSTGAETLLADVDRLLRWIQ